MTTSTTSQPYTADRPEIPPPAGTLTARWGHRMYRHARGTARVAAHFPGCWRGPDDIYPARREEPARTHLRSSRIFAAEVMPEFRENDTEREARKLAELGPAIEAAFARKRAMPSPSDSEIPTYQAYGTTVALTEADIAKLPEANRRRVLTFRRIAEIAERA